MQWFPWLTPYYKRLIEQHQAQQAHPAQIVHAHQGMGAEALVWGVARWLLCESPQGHKACGQCHGCQLMLADNHPDWYPLSAEKGKQQIGIDVIRDTCEKVWHSPQQGGARVVWIDGAQRLTESAVNALLKTVEEPPANCWFLFTTPQLSHLPATLRSRCVVTNIAVPQEPQGLAWLARESQLPEPTLLTALRLSGGAPAQALTLINAPHWQKRQQIAEGIRSALPQQPMHLLPILMDEPSGEKIYWLMAFLLDALKLQRGGQTWLTHVDSEETSRYLCTLLGEQRLQQVIARCRDCHALLTQTPQVNTELVISDLLLTWETLLTTSQ
ncbi:DNA polymerase III subunit delta' C-terminal domain-containing protein [Tatumella ptyseos]|uniref:DNA polymerase III subunit delta' C-terminal domain-containing protein n=1 Tax=Tatumella ptyseos TaxID=82987 RepID=UPI0026EE236C|nr:DNA polymerase III subunit delta' C-terminal domain-containing protein [Tatumella ptyseos]WKX27733.1 DNA polymerase III subunit delta' C-terminal domain-containing protein [Tatumella ptyseos]